jgi:hypothetical protein
MIKLQRFGRTQQLPTARHSQKNTKIVPIHEAGLSGVGWGGKGANRDCNYAYQTA